jgi:transcriptional regulator with XRE-family HTH domain
MLCRSLQDWRKDAGLSQRGLSRKLGRPITFASKVEARERRLDPTEFAEWARVCGVANSEVLRAMGL